MSETITIPPHGGKLIDRVLHGEAQEEAISRAPSLRRIALNARTMSDLELIAVGAYSPLQGFLGEADYRSVIHDMRLAGGLAWPLPITLGARLADGGGVPEPAADPPRSRIHPEVRPGAARRPPDPSAGREDQARRAGVGGARPLLPGARRAVLPEGSRHPRGVPGRDALRGAARDALPGPGPEELRVHALHRRPGVRRDRDRLGPLDRGRDLPAVRPGGARRHPPVLRRDLLLPALPGRHPSP